MKIAPFEMKFTIPTAQGMNIYSPMQKLISSNKILSLVAKDTVELSCYNVKQVENTLNLLAELKAKFKMDTTLF